MSKLEQLKDEGRELFLSIDRLIQAGKRGSPEHLELRAKLHANHDQRHALVGETAETDSVPIVDIDDIEVPEDSAEVIR